jgi:glutathione S-transferase
MARCGGWRMRWTGGGFLVGDALSLADVALVAYSRVADQGGFDLADYPSVQGWVGRVETVLKITD